MRLMRMTCLAAVVAVGSLMSGVTMAQSSGSATNLPQISVIGNLTATNHEAKVDEIETAFQGYLDPNIRADVFLSLGATETGDYAMDIEEAFLTLSGYWEGIGMKVGKKRANFGKENAKHPEQWNMMTLPLAAQYFLGEEGFAYQGGSVDMLLPLPFFCQWEVGVGSNKHAEAEALNQAILQSRLWASWNWEDQSELEAGVSVLSGQGPQFKDGQDEEQLYGMDVTYKVWTGTYSKWISQTEAILSTRKVMGQSLNRWGISSFLGVVLDPRWETGIRLEYAQHPDTAWIETRKVTGQLIYRLSETTKTRVSLGYDDQLQEMQVGFQMLFGIGPHSHVLQ